MNWITKLQNIDRRVIYVILVVVCLIPMMRPLGIPLSIAQSTQKAYDKVEALDPARDIVLVTLNYAPGSAPDIHEAAVAMVEHLAERGVKFWINSFVDTGPMFGEQILSALEAKGYKYGTDFVNLPFLAGTETAVRNFGADPRGSYTVDTRGNPIDSLPVMQLVDEVTDFTFFACFESGGGYMDIMRQVTDPNKIPFMVGMVTVSIPNIMPFYNSGQLFAFIAGLRGAAEYEMLLGTPGTAAAKMDAQSLGHIVIIVFIVLGNVAHFAEKRRKQG